MKKLLTLLFITMPLMAFCWGSAENEYRVTFIDGKVAEPIYTKSYSFNWDENKGLWKFYFNDENWYYKNLETVKKCNVERHYYYVVHKRYPLLTDGFICFKHVDTIEKIK